MPPDPAATVEGLLREGATVLRQAGIDGARLDARILLADVLKREPNALLPGDETLVSDSDANLFRAYLSRRAVHEPVARIIGRREFFGRSFRVSPATLDPRADSEALIELALEVIGDKQKIRILDLGTGTGCLLFTLLSELPGATGVATDLSPEALATAALNAMDLRLTERVTLLEGSWFEPVSGTFDLIVSNPPYIAVSEHGDLMADVRDYDPSLALFGGSDGLDAYRAILGQASTRLRATGTLVLEIGSTQEHAVTKLAEANNLRRTGGKRDLGQHLRALSFISR